MTTSGAAPPLLLSRLAAAVLPTPLTPLLPPPAVAGAGARGGAVLRTNTLCGVSTQRWHAERLHQQFDSQTADTCTFMVYSALQTTTLHCLLADLQQHTVARVSVSTCCFSCVMTVPATTKTAHPPAHSHHTHLTVLPLTTSSRPTKPRASSWFWNS